MSCVLSQRSTIIFTFLLTGCGPGTYTVSASGIHCPAPHITVPSSHSLTGLAVLQGSSVLALRGSCVVTRGLVAAGLGVVLFAAAPEPPGIARIAAGGNRSIVQASPQRSSAAHPVSPGSLDTTLTSLLSSLPASRLESSRTSRRTGPSHEETEGGLPFRPGIPYR